jgi:4-hydroxy-tetrahydrodipicolinate reductase
MNKGIGIAGIAGRMGRLLAEEVLAAGAPLVGGVDRPDASLSDSQRFTIFSGIDALAAASDIVVDFTHSSTALDHARAIANAGAAWVLGTTGLSAADEAAVAVAARSIPVMYAANYSPGVTLILAMAERMAAALPSAAYDAEIVEMHHRQKVDAPSGTAVALGRAVASGRGVALEDVRESGRDGHTGARKDGAIGFSARSRIAPSTAALSRPARSGQPSGSTGNRPASTPCAMSLVWRRVRNRTTQFPSA